MKQFLAPSGYHVLQEIIDSLEVFKTAFDNEDITALTSHYMDSAKLISKLLPFITNKEVSKMLADAASRSVSLAKRLANGGDRNDVAEFENQLALQMSSS